MAAGLNASRIHASESSDRKTLPRALQTRSAGDGAFFLGRLDLAACLRASNRKLWVKRRAQLTCEVSIVWTWWPRGQTGRKSCRASKFRVAALAWILLSLGKNSISLVRRPSPVTTRAMHRFLCILRCRGASHDAVVSSVSPLSSRLRGEAG